VWSWKSQKNSGFCIDHIFANYAFIQRFVSIFVGIGQITENAQPIREVEIKGRPLISLPLECKQMDENIDKDENCEYVALVKWIRSVPESEAKFRSGIYTTTHVRASFDNQPETRSYLEEAFGVNFGELAR
jgi:hypothetical protein